MKNLKIVIGAVFIMAVLVAGSFYGNTDFAGSLYKDTVPYSDTALYNDTVLCKDSVLYREQPKWLIFPEAKTVQLSPDEKHLLVVDKFSNLIIITIDKETRNSRARRIIASDVFSGFAIPKYWSPSGQKIAYMVMNNDVPSGIFIYDFMTNTSKRISSEEEDAKYHPFLIGWENESTLMVVHSPLDRPEEMSLMGYEESGERRLLMPLSTPESFYIIDDVSESFILLRDTVSGKIELYDRDSYKKAADVKGPAENLQHFRQASLIGDTGKVFIKEFKRDYTDANSETLTVKTSVFDMNTLKEEVISNEITEYPCHWF